jgi:hypothetical protein
MVKLPAEGYRGKFPDFPLDNATGAEIYRWKHLWRTSQAAAWIKMDIELMVARYVRNCILVENDNHTTVAIAHLHSEIRQLEDRLGLSPLALRRLAWEITEDEVADKRDDKPRRRLVALETDNAAEA